MRIGERIKQRRLELGYTADALAKLLNKNRATIYRYENGDIENMPIDVLEPLAKALNTTPAYLMGWQEPHQGSTSTLSKQTEDYYLDAETAEYAEMLRTRPEMRMLFSASRGISKEEMQEAVNYIEFIKSRNKK
ncbi:MAG: helix-turn-helix transcriptional regulator [Veillonella sp.]|jgi:DNA-binding helix-turn-helix protein|nr:helix-turn-helix transcriptional regulator [Veillonella sp.]MDU2576039.1 helix-turn-helix transcriptional regulator [Veillonella sp.]